MPHSVLSRCVCASTRPGRAIAPPASIAPASGAFDGSPIAAILPSRMRIEPTAPPMGRTLLMTRSFATALCPSTKLWIERIAQPVAQEIDGQHDQGELHRRERHDPPQAREEVLIADAD